MGLLLEFDVDNKGAITGIKQVDASLNKYDKTTKQASKSTQTLNKSYTSMGKTVVALGASYVTLNGIIAGGQAFLEMAETATLLESRLNLVTESTDQLNQAQAQLFSISQDTRVSLESTTDLYTRLARTSKELGTSQDELLGITRTINQALIVSGASATSANASLLQLSQGLASGVLRGEEFNSVVENTPRLAQALADGLDVGIGKLRELAQDGKLTADVVIEAFKSQAQVVSQEFGQITQTVAQSQVQVSNAMQVIIGDIDSAVGVTETLSESISGFSDLLVDNKEEIVEFATVTSAVIGKTVDGVQLLFATVESTAVGIVASVNTVVFGALRPITTLLLNVTKGLNTLKLSSDNTLESMEALAKKVENQYQFALTGFKFAVDNTKDSLEDFAITVEERIVNSKADQEIRNIEKEFGKLNDTIEKTNTAPILPTTATTDKQKESVVALNENLLDTQILLSDNMFTARTFENGVESAFKTFEESAGDAFTLGETAFSSFANNSADALANFVSGGKASFKDFASSVIRDIARIAIQQQATGLFGNLLGGLFSGVSLSGSALGSANIATSNSLSSFGSFSQLTRGFAEGGYTGTGDKYQPAGVVHKGEYVFTKEQTNRIGLSNLDKIAKGYANGGAVGTNVPTTSTMPNITIVNNTGSEAKAETTTDNQGNIQVLVELVEEKIQGGIKQGNSDFSETLESVFGLSRGSR